MDRISEQALGAKKVSKLNALDVVGETSNASAVGRPKTVTRRSTQPLLQVPETRMASIKKSMSQFGRTQALQLVFKCGLSFVALCNVAELISVVTAAVIQAKCVSH